MEPSYGAGARNDCQFSLHFLSPDLFTVDNQGVCLGSGIGSFEEAYNTALAYDKGVSPLLLFFIVNP